MLARLQRKERLIHCWWEYELVQPLWKAGWRFLKELKQIYKKQPNYPIKKWGKYMNRHFPKEDIYVANRHMKKSSS